MGAGVAVCNPEVLTTAAQKHAATAAAAAATEEAAAAAAAASERTEPLLPVLPMAVTLGDASSGQAQLSRHCGEQLLHQQALRIDSLDSSYGSRSSNNRSSSSSRSPFWPAGAAKPRTAGQQAALSVELRCLLRLLLRAPQWGLAILRTLRGALGKTVWAY
ncbi:hypothetical protein Efla_000451 [Eimeria flavescens]